MKHPLTLFWFQIVVAILAGAIAPLSLAPYNIWPLGLLSVGLLAFLTTQQTGKRCLLLALAFGLGLYGVGASWVYISISQFGSTSTALSFVLTAAFVSGLALCFALPFYCYGRWFSHSRLGLILAFPAVWVLGEWMRSWFLTGFPWLYVGYGHVDTWLAGWAPVFGVFGVSLVVAFSAAALTHLARDIWRRSVRRTSVISLCAVLALWPMGALLNLQHWTTLADTPITVGMAQGNIPQELKWDRYFLSETFRIFNTLSDPLWQLDWVIWPEAAIPLFYHEAQDDLALLHAQAKATDTVFITGILYDDREKKKYYNSLVARGAGDGIAYKTRLVPFGEYVPLERWLRGAIAFFNLPTSIIHPGPEYETGLSAKDVVIAPTICYEVVYPDLVAARAADANVLLTVSNDAWFGYSIGPVQHFEMAQMRALETGRYMVRATNNGLSGIIDSKGQTLVQGGRFTRESITGSVYSATGITPFIWWRSWPIVIACFGLLAFLLWRGRRARQQ